MSAQLEKTTTSTGGEEAGREGAMVAASSVSRMARRAEPSRAERHFHIHTSVVFLHSHTLFPCSLFTIKRETPTKTSSRRVAESPAQTAASVDVQTTIKNGAQLAVPPDVQH